MHEAIAGQLLELRRLLRTIRLRTLAELGFKVFLVVVSGLLLGLLGIYGAARLGLGPAAGIAAAALLAAAWAWAVLDFRRSCGICLSRSAVALEVERVHGLQRGELL